MEKWYAGYNAATDKWQVFKTDSLVVVEANGYDAISRPFDSEEELLTYFPNAEL